MRELTAVVMAKFPRAGAVKTRLVESGFTNGKGAAALAWAMLECVVERLGALMPVVVAVSPDDAGEAMRERLGQRDLRTVRQGGGNLGERLDRVWRDVGEGSPIAFFGCDSPDVPIEALREMMGAVQEHDLAVGPTMDGGYWTLASSRYRPGALAGIDWGTGCVYDQTVAAADRHGWSLHSLPRWWDVDLPADVHALGERLVARRSGAADGNEGVDEALARLAEATKRVLETATG